jgi:hypothetical protein
MIIERKREEEGRKRVTDKYKVEEKIEMTERKL